MTEGEGQSETEKTSNTGGNYASAIREQRYVCEPIETKYLKF